MNIDNLIRTLCPEGVKRVRLGDCCVFQRGSTITAKDAVPGDVPVIAGGQKPAYYHNVANRFGETITVAGSGAYAGFVAYWKQPIYVSDAFTIAPKDGCCSYKYLYYFLKNNQEWIHNTKKGSGVPHVHPSSIDNLLLPLPPLPVQESIVSYLDKLTSLTAELEAELELQKKRYDFYRNRLLSFAPDPTTQFGARLSNNGDYHKGPLLVKWAKLGEIGTFTKGSGILKSDFVEKGFPCIHYGQVHTSFHTFANKEISYISEDLAKKCKKAHKGDLIIASTSEDVEACCKAVAWMGDYDVAVSGDAHIFSHNQNPKYMAYLFQTEMFQKQKRPFAVGAKVIRVKSENMEKFCFPLPPLSEQERIVGILDKYETLVNDTRQGIPALINAVQRKYEYYRERLLTF